MNNTKKIIVGTLIAVVTLGSTIAFSGPGFHHGKFGKMNADRMEFILDRISNKLELTSEQKLNLDNLKDTMVSLKTKEEKKDTRGLIVSLLSQPILDESQILAEIEHRTNTVRSEAPTAVAALAQFTNSLSDEQRVKIIEGMERFSKKHRG